MASSASGAFRSRINCWSSESLLSGLISRYWIASTPKMNAANAISTANRRNSSAWTNPSSNWVACRRAQDDLLDLERIELQQPKRQSNHRQPWSSAMRTWSQICIVAVIESRQRSDPWYRPTFLCMSKWRTESFAREYEQSPVECLRRAQAQAREQRSGLSNKLNGCVVSFSTHDSTPRSAF